MATWESFPAMSTQPYGVEKTGLVAMLHPPTPSTQLVTVAGGTVMLASLPTTDPHIAGAVWNNAGVPEVSAG